MTEVLPHQRLDTLLRLPPVRTKRVGHFLLQIVAQHVNVAASFEMDQRSDALQKILGILQRSTHPIRLRLERRRFEQTQMSRRHDVAETARGALEIRFELIDGAAELLVPLVNQLQQQIQDAAAVLLPNRAQPRLEALEELGIAREETGVEQREQELRIAGIELVELREIANVLADGEAQIPERLEQLADETLVGGGERLLEEDQQVNVGLQ